MDMGGILRSINELAEPLVEDLGPDVDSYSERSLYRL